MAMHWLKQLLSRSQPNNWEQTNLPVETPKKIMQVLQKLAIANASAKIHVEDSIAGREGNILDIDKKNYTFSISLGGQTSVPTKGTKAAVLLSSGEIQTHFNTEIQSASSDKWFLDIPTKIYYVSRREAERVSTGPIGTAKIVISHINGEISGTLFDLSAGGVGGIIKTDLALSPGGQHTCFIAFADGTRLMTQMEIKHIAPDPKPGYLRLGLAFCDLASQDKITLDQQLLTK